MHVVTAGLVYVYSADSGVITTSSGYSDMFEFNQSGIKSWARCGEKKKIYKTRLPCVELNGITQSKLMTAEGG